MGLFGEVGQDVALVAGGDADHPSVLGSEQDPPVLEAAEQGVLHLAGDGVGLVVLGGTLGDGNRVGARQAQPELFGTCGEMARVAASVEQVVDELASGCFFLPYDEALCALVSVREGVDGLCDDGHDAARGCRGGPAGSAGREMFAHEHTPSVARCRGFRAELAAGLQFVTGEAAASGGGFRQNLDVAVEELAKCVVRGHVPLLPVAGSRVPVPVWRSPTGPTDGAQTWAWDFARSASTESEAGADAVDRRARRRASGSV